MCSRPVLSVQEITKVFNIYQRPRDRFTERFLRRSLHRTFTAVNRVSFELASGETMGIIGENGSGKSTLLKLIANILLPDGGVIRRNGRITGLLELGTGFNPQLSGRRNIFFNGAFLGLSREELKEHEEAIIDFAELSSCIDDPLKTYSSGMTMRLAYAVAMHAHPKCFIIDEALSVGDVAFQQKCFAHLKHFTAEGGSILFVSHDMNAVKLLCTRALLLDHGTLIAQGEPEEVINLYNKVAAAHGRSGEATRMGYGNGDVRFTSVSLTNDSGTPVRTLTSGDALNIRFTYACLKKTRQVTFGVMIRDRFGQDVFGSNGALLGTPADVTRDGEGSFYFPSLAVGPGAYTVNLAAHTGETHLGTCYHWWDNAAAFEVVQDSSYLFSGHTRLSVTLTVTEPAGDAEEKTEEQMKEKEEGQEE